MAKTETSKKGTTKKGLSSNDSRDVRLEALQAALGKIEKDYGRGAVMKLGDEAIENIEVIPTGSIGLNYALGVGGFPRGRISEIFGPESSGKTTVALHAIAEAQRKGGIAALIDAEHAFDRFYAQNLGVDTNNLLISQPDNGEQALEIAEQLIRSSAIDIIVIDSVAALTPKTEIEGEMGDRNMGLQARLMSQAMRKLTGAISRTNTVCIFINQLREKIGSMFGPAETTTGGNALKFYASVRIDIRPRSSIKKDDEVLGKRAAVKVVKNKVAPPFRRAEFDIMFGTGISRSGEIIDLGVEYGIIKKSGSWFSYNDAKLAQGRDAAKTIIEDNPELAEELSEKIFAAMKAQNHQPETSAAKATRERLEGQTNNAADKTTAKVKPGVEQIAEDDFFDDTLDDEFSIEEDL
ncbi:MAG: recombinase RecA [Muribaculaceae bacterium]|nr:recombinase RecA [Muribaculaceae bacterium]